MVLILLSLHSEGSLQAEVEKQHHGLFRTFLDQNIPYFPERWGRLNMVSYPLLVRLASDLYLKLLLKYLEKLMKFSQCKRNQQSCSSYCGVPVAVLGPAGEPGVRLSC